MMPIVLAVYYTVNAYSFYAASNRKQRTPDSPPSTDVDTQSIDIGEPSDLLRQIGRHYPITQMINTEDAGIVLFCQDSTTQEQRLNRLQEMLDDFVRFQRHYESTLPQLEAKRQADNTLLIQKRQITFRPTQIFRTDSCDRVLKDKASTLYAHLIIAYQKQEASGNDNCLIGLERMIKQFNHNLGRLSDNVSRYAMHSSAFSMARHIESLTSSSSKESYNPGLFGCWDLPTIDITVDDIDFLKTISRHEHCDDAFRYAALKVLEQKSGSQTYRDPELKKVLNKGLSHTHHHVDQSLCFKMLRDFCHENSIILSDDLQLYLNSFMRERGRPMC